MSEDRYANVNWDSASARKIMDNVHINIPFGLNELAEKVNLRKETVRVYIDSLYRAGKLSRVKYGNASAEYAYVLHTDTDIQIEGGEQLTACYMDALRNLSQSALSGNVVHNDLEQLRVSVNESVDYYRSELAGLVSLQRNYELWQVYSLVQRLGYLK